MSEPPSPTVTASCAVVGRVVVGRVVVVGTDEQDELAVDVTRWCQLAAKALEDGGAAGELSLTFVDRDEIAALNAAHLGHEGPTDVLSFPLDEDFDVDVGVDVDLDVDGATAAADSTVPILLGDVVVCPGVAADQAATHAGTLDDELALLVVHGVLHVRGHDHARADDSRRMRTRELELLQRHHWAGPPPSGFRQEEV